MIEINTHFADGVFTIIFNRPHKKNAMTQTMMKTIISKLEHTIEDGNVKVVVLTGAGDFYCSGSDFSFTDSFDVAERLTIFGELVAAMIDYPKLLVAVVNGPALGMACTTLALCDIVYASQEAYFQTPFTKLGLVAEGCSTYTFPRIFGNAKAAKLLYLSEAMSVQEAAVSGLVTDFFPHQQLRLQADVRIKELASLPLQSLMMTKLLARGWERDHLHSANVEELKMLYERFHSMDFLNAISNAINFKNVKSKL